jgi:catechol-2,3-dioxygenase
MQITSLGRASLRVRDLEASARFYSQILRMPIVRQSPGHNQLGLRVGRCNEFVLEAGATPSSQPSGLPDVAFVIGNNPRTLEAAATHLKENGIAFEAVAHEEYESIYLRDPDGHLIELYYWPEW